MLPFPVGCVSAEGGHCTQNGAFIRNGDPTPEGPHVPNGANVITQMRIKLQLSELHLHENSRQATCEVLVFHVHCIATDENPSLHLKYIYMCVCVCVTKIGK
jgi:hypothetical protein